VAFRVPNRDARLEKMPPIHRPRPGHADLAGMLRYGIRDARDVLERASARETVVRVVAGVLAAELLGAVGTRVIGFVRAIGCAATEEVPSDPDELVRQREASVVLCPDAVATARMIETIDAAKADGDSLGGMVEIRAHDPLPGIGSVSRTDERLDAALGAAMMSIHAVKAMEIGDGFTAAAKRGTQAHDAVLVEDGAIRRPTNHAGGIEGGMANGEPIVVRLAMKPLPTVMKPLPSVDLSTGKPDKGHVERADVCAVPALSVIAEATVALVLADALLSRVGGASLDEVVEAARRARERGRGILP
jgi:chorismate synthase